MRKHPLIALIAFAFLAISTFVGAAGAGNINSVPVRVTSHLSERAGGPATSRSRSDNLRWLAAIARARAAASRFSDVFASERYSLYWHRHAADLVAIHDGSRPPNGLLPSQWRAIRLRAFQLAKARADAAIAYAIAQAEAQALATAQSTGSPSVTPTTLPPIATLPPPPPPPPPPPSKGGELGGVWLQLRLCESGNNYRENTGNGYYGAYQFSLSTWESIGYSGLPSSAPPAVQDQAAEKLQALAGWGQWPGCSAQLGL